METEELKILLAIEPTWTVSCNGLEFQTIRATEISIKDSHIRLGKWSRRIDAIEWLRPDVVRIRGHRPLRSGSDVFTLYPGDRLPSAANLRRRRRSFQTELGKALGRHFKTHSVQKQTLFSDRTHGIGGAYPRFIVGDHAVIAVDPDESSATINAVMRAAMQWAPVVRRRVTVVIPKYRAQTVHSRLARMSEMRGMFDWLQWDGESVAPLAPVAPQPDTEVHDFIPSDTAAEVARVVASVRLPVQPVLNIAGRSVSIRFRGIDVAHVREGSTDYPLGEPLDRIVDELDLIRRPGSRHPLSRAYEERWLESNLIGEIGRLLPSLDPAHVYPQVPSFVGEERNIIDLLTVTRQGRLVVMEIKASADPDLPFQALDYWIAVERHRKASDFERKGYFKGVMLSNQPALLVLVGPLLAFHKTLPRLLSVFPREVPLIQIGLNQMWKKEIKILRRQDGSVRLNVENSHDFI